MHGLSAAAGGRAVADPADIGHPSARAIGAPMLRYPHARTGHWLNWQSTGLQNRGLQVRVLRAPLLRPIASPPSVNAVSSRRACGRSVVAAQKPSKLLGRVRFPSPA